MSYKVIHCFADLQDSNYEYKVGDKFPRLDLTVSDKRIKELSSANNKRGKALIEKVETKEEVVVCESKDNSYSKTEINRMSTAELKKIATSENIEDVENLTGAEIKKLLIKKFNL